MRPLLFFILLSVCFNSVLVRAQSQTQPPKPKPQKKSLVKNVFTAAVKKKKAKDSKDSKQAKAVKKKIVDLDQVQEIIDSLPEQDKRIISAVRVQISTWPKEVFDEISAYREFVISARNIAKQKYTMLSPEAKNALETEKQLKAKLSPSTAQTLEGLEVKIN